MLAVTMALCAAGAADARTWTSTYDWAHGHGYNGFAPAVSSADPAGYGLTPALGGGYGEWIWLTGDREYRPGSAEWRFTAPGTTRIQSARFELSYADKLLAHHCVTVGIGETSALRSARTDCSPATDSAAASFAATDPSSASPASRRAVMQVSMPPCHNPSDTACSKYIPSLDPLKNGSVARLKSLDMTLVDDDLPQVGASGPLRDLADRYIDGRSSYGAAVSATDGGSGVKGAALVRVGAGDVATFPASCDPTHNTPSLGAAICPPSVSGSTTVDANALPEGRATYRATASDLAGNAGASGDWAFFVDRTPPPAPEAISADYDEEQSGAAVWWTSNADPDLPDGSPGSGAVGEVFRYKLGDGGWTDWAPTELEGFTLDGVAAGTHLSVEARTSDAVGNLSPVATGEFDLNPPAECSPEDCPDGDGLDEESFAAQCDGSASQPDWCEYVSGVYEWADQLTAAADGASQGKVLAKTGLQGAVAKLVDGPPLPPDDFKRPADCSRDALSVKQCFDAVDSWQAAMTAWLTDHGLTGDRAARLPQMPVFDDARSDLARDLTRAESGAFGVVADTREDRRSEGEIRISFDSPVGSGYLNGLLSDLHADGADAMRGTFFGRTSTITAGYSAGDSDLRTQVRSFYSQQIDGTDSILDGLRADLTADQNDAQRRATRAEIGGVERFRNALDDRDAFVSAIVVRGSERNVLRELTTPGSPVQSVAPVSSQQEPDAAGAPQPARAIAAEDDEPSAASPKPAAAPSHAKEATVRAAGGLTPHYYMPNRWNVRTMAERSTGSPYVKNSYAGFRWTQSMTLDWYQHDDHHDRGFEVQVHPYKGGGLWSTNWYKTHWNGDNVTRGPCPDTRPGCSAVWNSNMPDAYRDDLSSDGDYKSFAVGSADAKSLKYGVPYFAWYLTNSGETSGGRAVAEGQATTRATNIQQEGYCKSHLNHDSACFFAKATKQIATYPLEERYHKYIRTW